MGYRLRRLLGPVFGLGLAASGVALGIACGEDGAPAVGPGAQVIPGDGGSDAPAATDALAADGGADVTADAACADVRPDDATGVFVATYGSDELTCGARTAPCLTVGAGVARALGSNPARSKVYVARGIYTEKLALAATIEVIGGWDVTDGNYARACVSPESAVVLRAPASASVTVEATNLVGEARLSLLTVTSKLPAQVVPGESLVGIRAVGATTTLVLTDVVVAMGNGGNGAAGTRGAAGDAGAGSCAAGTGAPGAAGTAGAGASAGAFDPTGYVPATATPGDAGTAGANGPPGGAGTCVTCGACGAAPTCDFVAAVAPQACGKPGAPGCAGGAGGPGGAATGGGSSIALYAWDADVTIRGGKLTSGDAGSGGPGGAGGDGGVPTKGAAGLDADLCVTACAPSVAVPGTCAATSTRGLGGAAGDAGGGGGAGGAGGGGAGGSSFAIYQGGTGVVRTLGAVTLLHGQPGSGGGPTGAAGTIGAAADRIP
jgi:hypothetical protein